METPTRTVLNATARRSGTERADPGVRNAKFAAACGLLGVAGVVSCCILPLALLSLGVGGAWIGNLMALAPYQPIFVTVTLGLVATGFHFVYRTPRAICTDGEACGRPGHNRIVKTSLWIATILVIARRNPGRPPKGARRTVPPQQVSALAGGLPGAAWRSVSWREGSAATLNSRFAALRVRPVARRGDPPCPVHWLLVEWPEGEDEPTKYWLSNLPAGTAIERLVYLAKLRWLIERDYQELKQELGLGHYEGRGWPGFHRHAALCIAAYGFLVAEKAAFPPSAKTARLVQAPELPAGHRPRGGPDPDRKARRTLDCNTRTPHRPGPGPKTAEMPLLRQSHRAAKQTNISFMTQ